MKKILAVLLCLLCLVSTMAVSVSGSFIEEKAVYIGSLLGFEEDDPIGYGIKYDSNKLLSGVSSIMYEPKPTVKLRNPGTYTVTDDYPLAVDYSFVCWKNRDTDKLYYPGDEIFIDGQITLYAVWEEKNDNNIRPVRVFLTAMQAFKKMLQSFFGVFKYEPVEKLEDAENVFDVEFLVTKEQMDVGIGVGREFNLIVKVPNGVDYENFHETEAIYFDGSMEAVNVEKYIYDTDSKGNQVIVDVIYTTEHQLLGSVKYSAAYVTTGEKYDIASDALETNGDKSCEYQIIKVTLTDGVPNPETGKYITFCMPRGLLRYKDSNGDMHYSEKTSITFFTTRDT